VFVANKFAEVVLDSLIPKKKMIEMYRSGRYAVRYFEKHCRGLGGLHTNKSRNPM
jgi:hypothetical protein